MADTATETTGTYSTRKAARRALRPRESQAPDADRICRRAEALLRKRKNVDNLQQELADFIIPRKAVITEHRLEGEELTERVWKSTPIRANELLAARIQGALTSPSVRWFSLKTRDNKINELFAVREWLNEVEERMYLAIRQSNFNQEMGEVYLDLGAFGIGAMLIEENPKEVPGFNGFLDVALAPGTYAIAESATGSVNTLYRFTKMTVAQCEEKFGLDALPEDWRELAQKEPDAEKDLIHAIEPRRVDNPKRKDMLHAPWSSTWVARAEKQILGESGYHEFPAIVPRWGKTSGEVYGRGPGHTALPDIRTLNRTVELGLQAASKALDPPGLVSSDATIVELDQRPGQQNTVEGDPHNAWVPMESGAKFDVGQILTQTLENDIRNTFYWDQLQLDNSRQMTLGEVQRRLEIMQQFLAPVLARLESEGLAPMLNRKFNIMWRAGSFPPPPPELKGQELDIEYEGPLARSQKVTRLAGFQEFTALTEPMLARNPAAADNLDDDGVYRDLAEVAGLPASYLRNEKERDGLRQKRQQKEEVQQKIALAQQAAGIGKDLAPAMGAMGKAGPQGGGGGIPEGAPDIEALLAQITQGQGAPA
jgi:hypothetical protein